jgi:metal-sulfur cluster biosynthetic enzyme
MVRRRLSTVNGVQSTEVVVVWEPTWSPQRISEEGRKILGIGEDE